MRMELDLILQIVAAFVAAFVVPFYLGLVHWSTSQYLLYSGGAGVALAAGEYLDTEPAFRSGIGSLSTDAILRSFGIGIVGGAVYLLAWLF